MLVLLVQVAAGPAAFEFEVTLRNFSSFPEEVHLARRFPDDFGALGLKDSSPLLSLLSDYGLERRLPLDASGRLAPTPAPSAKYRYACMRRLVRVEI